MNNGRYTTDQYKRKQAEKSDRLFGKIEKHNKVCACCENNFVWEGRKNTKMFERAKFCSRTCSNSIGGKAKARKHHTDETASYTVVAWRHHKKKCVVCPEEYIVAVHHLNENHEDNDPKNLVPLCPTHHQYMHSRYKYIIEDVVTEYVTNRWKNSGD